MRPEGCILLYKSTTIKGLWYNWILNNNNNNQEGMIIKAPYTARVDKSRKTTGKLFKLWSVLKQLVVMCGPKAAYFDRIEYVLCIGLKYKFVGNEHTI